MKKVLVLCTGNSCRSIMAEALINARLEGVEAYSSGVRASGEVNPHARALLMARGLWRDHYHSKALETMMEIEYDLIITVCDHAHETCPIFPRAIPTLHMGFSDPSGGVEEGYLQTLEAMEDALLPRVREMLLVTRVEASAQGVQVHFTEALSHNTLWSMVRNCQEGQCECMSPQTKAKITAMELDDHTLTLQGSITTEEIEEALGRSKVLQGV